MMRHWAELNSFEKLTDGKSVEEFFSKNFPDAMELMPTLPDDFFHNPTGSLITIKCFPWSIDGKIAMLGDSCHAIVPFFGQGMNAAFEDCTYLNECIGNNGDDWNKVFKDYQKMRKINTDAIADLARENFIEMRDLVATPHYQLKKKIESELYKIYPGKFIPKYSMVTFLRIPYSTALERGKIQEQILEELSENISTLEEVNWDKAKLLIAESIPNI